MKFLDNVERVFLHLQEDQELDEGQRYQTLTIVISAEENEKEIPLTLTLFSKTNSTIEVVNELDGEEN